MYETKITTDVDIITFFKSNNFFLKKNLSKKKIRYKLKIKAKVFCLQKKPKK